MGRPLKIAKATLLTLTDTNASTEVITVSQNLTTLRISKGTPFIPASTVGGLTGGTTYWILEITGDSTFTASATHPSANPTNTPVNLSTTTGQTVTLSVGYTDLGFQNPDTAAQSGNTSTNPGVTYGVVGGNTGIYGKQTLTRVAIGIAGVGTITVTTGSANITGVGTDLVNALSDGSAVSTSDGTVLGFITDIANANATFATFAANSLANATASGFVYANDEAGYIMRQKGKSKYLVTGGTTGLTAQCTLANVANTALTPNTMNILATYADSSTKYVSSLNDYRSEVFPTVVAAASLVANTVYTIQSVGTTSWTSVGAFANMTGITFTATGAGSGTGTAVLSTSDPDVIATFNTAYAANTYDGQTNPIVVISNT